MLDKNQSKKSALKIHIIGVLACGVIAGSSVYFAGSAISKRRGLFLSARHELANIKVKLNDSVSQRVALSARVRSLSQASQSEILLHPMRDLNTRTAAIVSLAESGQIRVDSLQPSDPIMGKRVPVQPIQLIGSAQASDVFTFLENLATQMPDIHVQSIDLTSTSADSSTVQITMQLYWFVDPVGESEKKS